MAQVIESGQFAGLPVLEASGARQRSVTARDVATNISTMRLVESQYRFIVYDDGPIISVPTDELTMYSFLGDYLYRIPINDKFENHKRQRLPWRREVRKHANSNEILDLTTKYSPLTMTAISGVINGFDFISDEYEHIEDLAASIANIRAGLASLLLGNGFTLEDARDPELLANYGDHIGNRWNRMGFDEKLLMVQTIQLGIITTMWSIADHTRSHDQIEVTYLRLPGGKRKEVTIPTEEVA